MMEAQILGFSKYMDDSVISELQGLVSGFPGKVLSFILEMMSLKCLGDVQAEVFNWNESSILGESCKDSEQQVDI